MPGAVTGKPHFSRRKAAPARTPPRTPHRRDVLRIAGLPAVEALFLREPASIQRLIVAPEMAEAAGPLLREANERGIAHRIVPAGALEKIAGTALNGGIVAETAPRPAKQFDLGQAQGWARKWIPLIVLDGIGNPHNLGAIARTAAFFGIPHLAISDRPDQAGPSEAAYRVSEGGLVWTDLYRIHRLPDMLRRLRDFYVVVGTALDTGTPLPVAELAKASKPVCLVMGNEERGLAPEILAACEKVAKLPGSGRVQSLNVSATAAIYMHALTGGLRPR
jgi:RNA methyltransferase, TrmH family